MATTSNNGWTIPGSTDLVKNGYAAIDTLGNNIDTSVGKGLLAWQTYTPTLSGGTTPAWSNGNGTYDAKYCQIGKTVHVSINFTLGSTSTKGNSSPTFTLPSGLPARALNTAIFPVKFTRSATYYGFAIIDSSTSSVRVYVWNAASTYLNADLVTSTVPGTWATGDNITFEITYETA